MSNVSRICNLCGLVAELFLPGTDGGEAVCPGCGSTPGERMRHLQGVDAPAAWWVLERLRISPAEIGGMSAQEGELLQMRAAMQLVDVLTARNLTLTSALERERLRLDVADATVRSAEEKQQVLRRRNRRLRERVDQLRRDRDSWRRRHRTLRSRRSVRVALRLATWSGRG